MADQRPRRRALAALIPALAVLAGSTVLAARASAQDIPPPAPGAPGQAIPAAPALLTPAREPAARDAATQEAAAMPAGGVPAAPDMQGEAQTQGPDTATPEQGPEQAQGQARPAAKPRPLTPAEYELLRKTMTDSARGVILSPAEIGSLRQAVTAAESAAALPGGRDSLPVARSRVFTVSAAAAMAAPLELTLAQGIASPITFLDAKGRPWPVASVSYDPRLFAQDGAGCGSANSGGGPVQNLTAAMTGGERPTTIALMPCRFDAFGNVSVSLERFAVPVVFLIRAGSLATRAGGANVVDLPVTVKLNAPEASPLAPARQASSLNAAPLDAVSATAAHRPPAPAGGRAEAGEDHALALFAAGTPPAGALRTAVSGADGVLAWIWRGRLYLRGRLTVENPAHQAMAQGEDGMRVWQMPRPVPRILIMREDGSEASVSIDF